MANIRILEKDLTTSSVYNTISNIVFIPGCIGAGKTATSGMVNVPMLFESDSEFVKKIGEKPKSISGAAVSTNIKYDKSLVMARQLLSLGVPVIYCIVGSNAGVAVEEESAIRARLGSDAFWQEIGIADRSRFNPRFITSGGYSAIDENDNVTIAKCLMNVAYYNGSANIGELDSEGQETIIVGRGDCCALIDHPASVATAADALTKIKKVDDATERQAYAAAFTPWCSFGITVDDKLTTSEKQNSTDFDEDLNWKLPGSFAYLLAFANMSNSYPDYLATAGITRGMVPNLVKPMFEIGEVAVNKLQSRKEGEIAVNPICNIIPYGYRIYGARTLKQNIKGLKATSFLSIRNLISDIKKVSYQACKRLAFEQNTDVMWSNLKAEIKPTLEEMLTGSGIAGYKITRVATTEKAKVVGKITIIPIEPVEDFDITVELSDTLEVTTGE